MPIKSKAAQPRGRLSGQEATLISRRHDEPAWRAIVQDGLEAGRARGGAAKRQGARPPGGEKQPGEPKLRVQYHLGKSVVERLGVHCSLVHRNESVVVQEILAAWLQRYGRGKELWSGETLTSPPTEDLSAA
jgi:hypothetical protein